MAKKIGNTMYLREGESHPGKGRHFKSKRWQQEKKVGK